MILKAGYRKVKLAVGRLLRARESVLVGVLNVDGEIESSTEPKLVKVESFLATTTTGAVTNILDLRKWLNVTAADLKHYCIEISGCWSTAGDGVSDDDFEVSISMAGDIMMLTYTEASIRFLSVVSGSLLGRGFMMPHDSTYPYLNVDFPSWVAAETHFAQIVVTAYKLPAVIVP